MLVPGVILTFIFSYIPLYGVIIAFEKYNVGMGFASPWVGLENFRYLFAQPTFTRTIWNTLYISFWKLALGIVVPVTIAVLLNEMASDKLKRFYQTLIYIPNFLSWIIMAGVLMDILSSTGAINMILMKLGFPGVDFLGNAKVFPWTMIISDVWKGFGYGTIVYLAALTGIDPSLYESAMLDGANRWEQIKNITIPLLMPTVVLIDRAGARKCSERRLRSDLQPVQPGGMGNGRYHRYLCLPSRYSAGAVFCRCGGRSLQVPRIRDHGNRVLQTGRQACRLPDSVMEVRII
jgi:putative aldouronate transport system permease protein